MITASLSEREVMLRRAVTEGQFACIGERIASYCELVDANLAALLPGDPARAELLAHVIDVFEWARRMIAVTRSGCEEQLTCIRLTRPYRTPGEQPGPALQMEC